MTLINKISLVVAAVGLLMLGGFLFKTCQDKQQLASVNSQLNSKLMEAQLDIGKAHTQFGDASKKASELDQQLQDQLKKNDELVTQYGALKAKFDASGKGTKTIVVTGPTVEVSKDLNLEVNNFYLATSSKNLLQIGPQLGATYEDFRLWADVAFSYSEKDNIKLEMNYKLHLLLAGQTIQTITPSGAVNNYFKLWEVDDKGNKTGNELKLQSYEMVVQDQRTERFFSWAPHLDLGAVAGYNNGFQTGASLGFSFMGYGKTENDLTWRFVRPGVTMGNKWGVDLAPVMYNLGDPLPVISNLWIGPYASWTFPYYIGGGLLVNLVL